MAKKNIRTKKTKTIKCQCSRCEQISNAVEGTEHFGCKGISPAIVRMLPLAFKGLTNPTRKGSWKAYQEPVKPADHLADIVVDTMVARLEIVEESAA